MIVHKKEVGYISLGGKIDPGETDEQCLMREVKEEISCTAKNIKYFETFEGPTHDYKQTIRLACYFCDIEGEIKLNPNDKVDGYLWLDKNYQRLGEELATMLRLYVMPELVKHGLL